MDERRRSIYSVEFWNSIITKGKIMKLNNDINDIFDSFLKVTKGEPVLLTPKQVYDVNLNELINQHIYGLLTQESLSPQQLLLLTALLNGRK